MTKPRLNNYTHIHTHTQAGRDRQSENRVVRLCKFFARQVHNNFYENFCYLQLNVALAWVSRCSLDRPRQMWQSWRDQKSVKPTEQQRLPTGCPVGNWNCNCNWNRNRHQQCHCQHQQQQQQLWVWVWGLFGSVRVRLSGDSANIQFNSLTGTQQAIKSLHIYIYNMYTRRHIYLFIIICRLQCTLSDWVPWFYEGICNKVKEQDLSIADIESLYGKDFNFIASLLVIYALYPVGYVSFVTIIHWMAFLLIFNIYTR